MHLLSLSLSARAQLADGHESVCCHPKRAHKFESQKFRQRSATLSSSATCLRTKARSLHLHNAILALIQLEPYLLGSTCARNLPILFRINSTDSSRRLNRKCLRRHSAVYVQRICVQLICYIITLIAVSNHVRRCVCLCLVSRLDCQVH